MMDFPLSGYLHLQRDPSFFSKKTRNICNLEAPTETEPVTEDLDQVGILAVPFFRCHLLYLVMVVMSLLMVLEIPQAPVEQ